MLNRRALLTGALASAFSVRAAGAQSGSQADWRLVAGTGSPGGRWDHTLSAVSGRSELLLAFGRDAGGAAFGDCWLADRSHGDWARVDAAGPSSRFGHSVASDHKRGLVYLYGGQVGADFHADLWAFDFDARTWELIHDGAGGPAARYGSALVHDGDEALFVLHGFTFAGRFDDVWRFDLARRTWEQVESPSERRPVPRCLHEAVLNRATGTILMYGGCSSGYGPCPQHELWELHPVDRTWRELPVAGPAGRSNPALVVDDRNERLLLTGGQTATGASSELWIGAFGDTGVTWTTGSIAGDAPAARSSHDAVLSGGALYLFGGIGPGGVTGDLWRLRLDAGE